MGTGTGLNAEKGGDPMDQHTIRGIHCDVENCAYNNGHCCCTANQVEVTCGPTAHQTKCGTFREN